jgi:hypothetical protein
LTLISDGYPRDGTLLFRYIQFWSVYGRILKLVANPFAVVTFGDINGAIHQWAEGEELIVNNYSFHSLQSVDPFPLPSCEMTDTRYGLLSALPPLCPSSFFF